MPQLSTSAVRDRNWIDIRYRQVLVFRVRVPAKYSRLLGTPAVSAINVLHVETIARIVAREISSERLHAVLWRHAEDSREFRKFARRPLLSPEHSWHSENTMRMLARLLDQWFKEISLP